jgi:predicted ATPase
VLKIRDDYRAYYDRIVRRIRNVLPQFGDFALEPLADNNDYVSLDWWENTETDYLFSAFQLSDGSLRFMALATLLLQPEALLPKLIVLDEPELGLHPEAVADLAEMIRSASVFSQIVVATQSTRLVDEFSLDEILVVERDEARRRTVFKKLDPAGLEGWLERYNLSTLWEKNVLGGKP